MKDFIADNWVIIAVACIAVAVAVVTALTQGPECLLIHCVEVKH